MSANISLHIGHYPFEFVETRCRCKSKFLNNQHDAQRLEVYPCGHVSCYQCRVEHEVPFQTLYCGHCYSCILRRTPLAGDYSETCPHQVVHAKPPYSYIVSATQTPYRVTGDQRVRHHCQRCHLVQALQLVTKKYTESMSQQLTGVPNVHACLEIGRHVLHGMENPSAKVDLKKDNVVMQLQAWADRAKFNVERVLKWTGEEPSLSHALPCRVSFRARGWTPSKRPELLRGIERAVSDSVAKASPEDFTEMDSDLQPSLDESSL